MNALEQSLENDYIDLAQAKALTGKAIDAGYEPRIENRSGINFLVVHDPHIGRNIAPSEPVITNDVDAVREIVGVVSVNGGD